MKNKTNEQRVNALIKEMKYDTILFALFTERLVKISELTKQALAKEPEAFNTLVTRAWMYEKVCGIIDKHLNE